MTGSAWNLEFLTRTAEPAGWESTIWTRRYASGRRHPVHGCLTPYVIHPAAYTFKLPENVSFAEGAMVEPLAVGMHAAVKAKIKPGDLAVVMGAGPIGIVTALAAIAGGCSQVVLTDVQQPKLDLAAALGPIRPVNVAKENLRAVIDELTEGWGADVVFEASGAAPAIQACA